MEIKVNSMFLLAGRTLVTVTKVSEKKWYTLSFTLAGRKTYRKKSAFGLHKLIANKTLIPYRPNLMLIPKNK